ncbi:FHA domain-containing protein [Adlercreutzia agrestimuris]|uniref:FHA domain-containing protein n=1 Tax=Adlercreutzia agrestimuris TaxID=2941324 RepID=UPI00203CE03F|nr:FHA domain-containing protein [Adlercreutzia agrestimuris]
MVLTNVTPCSVLFDTMKRLGGVSYKETASLILSSKPMGDGPSPVSRVNDRSWLSRFIVHAPVVSLDEHYFGDAAMGAMRLISRLKSKTGRTLTSKQILDIIYGAPGELMKHALEENHQDLSLYNNVLDRIAAQEDLSVDEKAELAMVLFVSAGCSASSAKAAEAVDEFSHAHQANTLATPPSITGHGSAQGTKTSQEQHMGYLCLLRVKDGFVIGAPAWISPEGPGATIGAMATGDEDIALVERDVSRRHAHIWCDEYGVWRVTDLASRNGTVLTRAADGAQIQLTPELEHPDGSVDMDNLHGVEIVPGDELLLGARTQFVVMQGAS